MKRSLGAIALGLMVSVVCGCGQGASTLQFADLNPAAPRLGEGAVVRFQVLDGNRQPLPGVDVTFALEGDPPGATIAPTQATTDTQGFASTVVTSQSRVSSLVVRATTGTGSASVIVDSPPLSFAGGSASSRQLTFQCGPLSGKASGGIHGIIAWDEARYMIAGVKLECSAHVGDRNGDGVPGAQVSFLTEAGTITPTATSVTDVIGNATVLYKTSLPFPEETSPTPFTWTPVNDALHTGDYLVPLWMEPWYWSDDPIKNYAPGTYTGTLQEPRRLDPIRPGFQLNPRDNLVSLIALTTGEEAFDDNNNNGVRDEGEPFVDTTEPFVDSNDNGTWDPGERFVDVNGDEKWNGKNGQYDAATTIWVQERILWTGVPHSDFDSRPPSPVFRLLSPPLSVAHFGSDVMQFAFADPWFNPIARDDNQDGCQLGGTIEVVKASPETFGAGIRFDYPPVDFYSVVVSDRHDPTTIPPPPPYSPAVAFEVPVVCTFTASPQEGFKLKFIPATAVGTVL